MASPSDRPADASGAFDCMGLMELYGAGRSADGSLWVHQWYESPDPARPIVHMRSVDWEMRPPEDSRLLLPLAGRGLSQLKVAWVAWLRTGEAAAVSLFYEEPLTVAVADDERWVAPPVAAADGTLHWFVWRPQEGVFGLVRHRFTGALESAPSVSSQMLWYVIGEPVASAALPMPDALGSGVVVAWLTVEAGLVVVEAAWLEEARVERRRLVTGLAPPAATEQRPGLQLRAGREVAVAFLAIDGDAPVLAEARLGFDHRVDAVDVVARPASWTEPARALSAYVWGTSSRLACCFIADAETRLWGLGRSGTVLLEAERPADHDLAIVPGWANLYEIRQSEDGTLRVKDFPALW